MPTTNATAAENRANRAEERIKEPDYKMHYALRLCRRTLQVNTDMVHRAWGKVGESNEIGVGSARRAPRRLQTTSILAHSEMTAPILLASSACSASSVKRWISAASTRDWRSAVRTADTHVRGLRLCVRMWISGYRRRIIMAWLSVTLPIRRTRARFRSPARAIFLRQFGPGLPSAARLDLEPP